MNNAKHRVKKLWLGSAAFGWTKLWVVILDADDSEVSPRFGSKREAINWILKQETI